MNKGRLPKRITVSLKGVFLVLLVVQLGCGSSGRTQTYWVNPKVPENQQRSQFTLDSVDCGALAHKAIPETDIRSQGQSGSIQLMTPTGPVYGTYQSQPANQGWQPSGLLAGYQRSEREGMREKYTTACMSQRGWQQK